MYYTNVCLMGDNILFRGIKDGKRIKQKIKYKPRLYVKSNKDDARWSSLGGEKLEEINFDSIRDYRNFIKQYESVANFPIYGNINQEYAFISDYFKGDINWDISELCICYLDIEVGSENGFPEPDLAQEEITAITICIDNNYYVFGCRDYVEHQENVKYYKCVNEVELINKFIDVWTMHYPDVLTGWYVKFFDVPYLVNRISKLLGEGVSSKLSPWNKVNPYKVTFSNAENNCFDIVGVSVLDYMELYRKFSPKSSQESFKLDHIAFIELGERKLDYSEHENLHQLYKKDYQKYVEYNIKDVELVQRIQNEGEFSSKLLDQVMTLAYDTKVNYDDAFSQVRMWDVTIYNELKERKISIPPKKISSKDTQYSGGYVKIPQTGMFKWVVSFDLDSLYPHLIMMYNLSPEMLVDLSDTNDEIKEFLGKYGSRVSVDNMLSQEIDTAAMKNNSMSIAPNGQLFNISKQGFLAEIMEKTYEKRVMYKEKAKETKKRLAASVSEQEKRELKKQMAVYNNIQLAKKVSLNSAYGAIGNQYFRYYDIRIAEAITMSGQLAIRWIEKKINLLINDMLKTNNVDYVIASDTDSIYLNLGPLVDKFFPKEIDDKHKITKMIDKFSEEKIKPYIAKSYQELADYVNAYAQKMKMKREAISDKAIWTSKKHYIVNVYDNEGVAYKTPELKIMGLEAVKSSTPTICREKLKEAFKVIINQDESALIKFVDEFKTLFFTLPPQDIAFPRGVNGLEKYSDSKTIFGFKTPMHVRGSLIFNHFITEKNLDKKYEKIKEGEKIKYIYLKEPNIMRTDVISFLSVIPEEFEIDKHIDYNTQFEKSFLEPLKIVLTAIKWNVEKTNSLEDFFS